MRSVLAPFAIVVVLGVVATEMQGQREPRPRERQRGLRSCTGAYDTVVRGGYVLTGDGSGDCYSSAAVSFGSGQFTNVTDASGTARAMSEAITSGACNRCHTTGSRI